MTHIINLNSFPGLPYDNTHISNTEKITIGQALPASLEGILKLSEGRAFLFHVVLKNGEDIFVKPYVSRTEKEVIDKLLGLDISPVLSANADYFVEERIRIPPIDSALAAKATFLDYVAGLFGRALYSMHSRGISYGGRFNDNVFADDLTQRVKVSNFSRARLSTEPTPFYVDVIEAFTYMEALAQQNHVDDKHFLNAIKNFKSTYARDDKSVKIWDMAVYYFLYVSDSPTVVKALNKLLPPLPQAIYPKNGNSRQGFGFR